MAEMVRAHVIVSGRVQGVAYRYSTQDAAFKYGVSGWVKNRRDGTVEAVFEGNQSNVEQIIKWCETGPRMADVSDVAVSWEEYSGSFDSFDITF